MSKLSDSRTATNLEQQRKRAKDLRRSHHDESNSAAERIARYLPRARGLRPAQILASSFTLSEAQLVVAREAGYSAWPALKHALERAPSAGAGLQTEDELLEAALAGDDARVLAALERQAASAGSALAVAAALLDPVALQARLDADPSQIDQPAGRRGWTPLLFACGSRYRRTEPQANADRVEIVRRLIARGANIHAVGCEPVFISAKLTAFGAPEWTVLRAAAGRAGSAELVRLLLSAGADASKAENFVDAAARSGDLETLQIALDTKAAWHWPLLVACVELDRPDMAQLLVEHAEHARILEPALHEALRRGSRVELIDVLLGDGALSLSQPVWQATYGRALRYGHAGAAELLRQRGIDESAVSPSDRLLGARVSGDRTEQERLSRELPRASGSFTHEDHRLLAWAVRNARAEAIAALLEIGLDPNVPDTDGRAPLHLAVAGGSLEVVEQLIAAGARIEPRDFDGRTPLEAAFATPDPTVRDRLTQRLLAAGASAVSAPDREDLAELFERAADAVAFGDLASLRNLLDEEPALVHARSPRAHRATLLHYCAANGTEDPRQRTPSNAAAVAQLLLERGADPNAECEMYGGGDTTMGLLLTSAFPAEAGVDGDLVRELVRAGAPIATVQGQGPMLEAIVNARPRAVAALVDAGVPLDDLLVAAAANRVDVLESLLASGIDVDTRFAQGWTALHAAAVTGSLEAVELLLEHGADPSIREDRFGGTAGGNARYNGFTATADRIDAARSPR